MNINKDGLEKLQKKFNDLTEISKKYSNMGYEKSSHINFRNPENEDEESFVKKVNFKHFLFLLLFTLIFLVCFVCLFLTKNNVMPKVLIGIVLVGCGYFLVKSLTTKELFIGKVIYKERKRSTNKKRRSYMYFVTIIDEENKLVHSQIQVSKNDYELIEEGTKILVSKGSNRGYIYE